MPRRFPKLSADVGLRPSVCIVTSEMVGPFNNGGIGTSMTGLAQTLGAAGFPVTVLYTGGYLESHAERDRWRRRYASIGITFVWLEDVSTARFRGPLARTGFTTPWRVHHYLRNHHFDVVQFNDCMGEGFYCLAARRLGIAFRDTTMFVGLHSPSQWIFEINRDVPDKLLHAAFNHAERLSVKCADVLWGPSRYLIDWASDKGFELPDGTYTQKYVLPTVPLFDPSAATPAQDRGRERMVPREIVFFGRLEERKGLRTFCQALKLLEDVLVEHGVKITFLGKEGSVAGQPALLYLAEEAKHWCFEHRLITTYGQQEAMAHLASGEALAIMASPADNSPCTVYEALSLGIPFVAARTGGIPELIDARDHADVLFEPRAEALASRIEMVIKSGIAPARPTEGRTEITRRWVSAFESHRKLAAAPPPRSERPLTVAAVVDAPAGTEISASILSLRGMAKIFVINRTGAKLPEAPFPVVAMEADMLEEGLAKSGADVVLFLRGGAILEPTALATLAQLVECPDVDGLVPAGVIGEERDQAFVPALGSSPTFCFYDGPMPGGAMFVRRVRLLEVFKFAAVPEAEFLGLPDFAVASGLRLWPLAEALVRHPADLIVNSFGGQAPERIRAYCDVPPNETYYISSVAQACFNRPRGRATALTILRERLIAWRLGWVVRLAKNVLPRALLRILIGSR